MLSDLKSLVSAAYKNDYAVPAFNVYTYEDTVAVVEAAEEMRSPVIIMLSNRGVKHLGLEIAASIMLQIAKQSLVPVVVHLDHAKDLDTIFSAMKLGFSSVMYDGSDLPFDQNVENTKLVVRIAKVFGVSVEGEIGKIGRSKEDEEEFLTRPADAKLFYELTQVDALAVAVGTRHGMRQQTAKIDFKRIEEIQACVDVPLVLHGSSGVSDEDLIKISKMHFGKVNFATILRETYVKQIRNILQSDPELSDHLSLFQRATSAIKNIVSAKIKLLSSHNKI